MVFSSPIFLFLFLPVLLCLYWAASFFGRKTQNLLLLAASLLFYAWGEREYILLILISIILNHICALKIGNLSEGKAKRRALLFGIAGNVIFLLYFKYAAFLAENLSALVSLGGFSPFAATDVHLPLGISFFTFQAISYLLDIYSGRCPAQKNIRESALYICLFPQLIAGPIVRYSQVAEQLKTRSVSASSFQRGVNRFVIGLGKKVLIANTLAEFVDYAFALEAQMLSTSLACN